MIAINRNRCKCERANPNSRTRAESFFHRRHRVKHSIRLKIYGSRATEMIGPITWYMWFLADGNGGGGGRPLFPQWSHHVYPQFLPGSHPNANANVNANVNHHINQHHHQHPLPAARHSNRQPPSNYYLPNHHKNHYNHHPSNHNYHRHHHYHHHNNNNHHHTLQKHIDQPRNLCHRNSGVGLQGNSKARRNSFTECSSSFSFFRLVCCAVFPPLLLLIRLRSARLLKIDTSELSRE